MNKKAQIGPIDSHGEGPPVLFIFGVIILVAPMILSAFNINIPFSKFIQGLGMVVIVIGIIMYAFKR